MLLMLNFSNVRDLHVKGESSFKPFRKTVWKFGKITHQMPGAILAGTKRNSEFCLWEGLSVPQGGAEGGKIGSLQKEMTDWAWFVQK